MTQSLDDLAVKAAIAAIESEAATLPEQVEMLIEVATGLQKKPKSPKQIQDAVFLYCRAIEICPPEEPLLRARALTGMGTALRTIPSQGAEILLEAKMAYETALPILQEHASPEAVAEVYMNLGLVLQALAPLNEARMQEAVQSYQRALRVFTGKAYPQEYAIVQNNIAIAYLSMSSASGTKKMYQALAIQTFEEALQWVTLIENPSEYAVLQNNLANTLQYLPSTHPVENNLRALAAYNEVLKVRTARDTPIEYANTIAHKAKVLCNLPDDIKHSDRLIQAKAYYQEAQAIFIAYGERERAEIVAKALDAIEAEL